MGKKRWGTVAMQQLRAKPLQPQWLRRLQEGILQEHEIDMIPNEFGHVGKFAQFGESLNY